MTAAYHYLLFSSGSTFHRAERGLQMYRSNLAKNRYPEHNWKIRGDLQILNIILGH